MIHKSRIRHLNRRPLKKKGAYVLYWMQQAQRAQSNHALTFAIQTANRLKRPVLVVFAVAPSYPEANLRHYTFMFEGLAETVRSLADRGIGVRITCGAPVQTVVSFAREACLVVCDRGYLRHQGSWRRQIASKTECRVIDIETDVIVPVETASQKAEYAARTIRPKINRLLDFYLQPAAEIEPVLKFPDTSSRFDLPEIVQKLTVPQDIAAVSTFLQGGLRQARKKLKHFIQNNLSNYSKLRNCPDLDGTSMLSPYLHFGQISALEVALSVQQTKADVADEDKQAFLEELIVRRELAANHAYFNRNYDRYEGLPGWALETLKQHVKDRREPLYTTNQLEAAQTHDVYWNAAMLEMRNTGFMHNYMRMYWGKKILQWSPAPEVGYQCLLELNNKYFLDGRDPNSYAGAGWVFGLHDRPWPERPVFGKVRYMASTGLERKFDMQGYIDKVRRRTAALTAAP